jgi:hypothetical protein
MLPDHGPDPAANGLACRTAGVVLLILYQAAASTMDGMQTEWTAPGAADPVRRWDGSFTSSSNVNWQTAEGDLVLDYQAVLMGLGGLGEPAAQVECGDVDGDGDCDLVALASSGKILYFENREAGRSFAAHAVFLPEGGPSPTRLALSDLDGDGDLDLAACGVTDRSILWLENAGSDPWTMRGISDSESGPVELIACDFDEDGDADLLVNMAMSGETAWFENSGAPWQWTRRTLTAQERHPSFRSMEAADTDLDGDLEILATEMDPGIVTLFDVEEDRMTAIQVTDCDGHSSFGDMDGDGQIDVVAASRSEDSIFWCREASGGWVSLVAGSGLVAPERLDCADFDSDGDLDICAVSSAVGETAWWENLGGGGAFSCHSAGVLHGCSWCSSGDIDSDGAPEIAVCSGSDGSIGYWEPVQYAASGSLVSSVLYTGPAPSSGVVEWDAETPPGTSVRMYVRLSDDRTRMGEWHQVSGGRAQLDCYLTPGVVFFQYKIELQTSDFGSTPTVTEVRAGFQNQLF